MGYLYKNLSHTYKKKLKPLYFSSKVWRSLYLIATHSLYQKAGKKIFNRGSVIPYTYVFRGVEIHNGRCIKKRNISRWMVGFKFGEFTLNRKIAVYKAKSKKKKKK